MIDGARDIDQINAVAKLLREKLEQKLDLPKHFGFLMHWHLVDTQGWRLEESEIPRPPVALETFGGLFRFHDLETGDICRHCLSLRIRHGDHQVPPFDQVQKVEIARP